MGLIYTIELLMLNLGTNLRDWVISVKSRDLLLSRSVIWLTWDKYYLTICWILNFQILKISQKLENSWINIVLKYQLQMTSFDPSRNFIESIIHYCVAVATYFSILNVSNQKFSLCIIHTPLKFLFNELQHINFILFCEGLTFSS